MKNQKMTLQSASIFLFFLLVTPYSDLFAQDHLEVDGTAKVLEKVTVSNLDVSTLRLERSGTGQWDVEVSNDGSRVTISGGLNGVPINKYLTFTPYNSDANLASSGNLQLGLFSRENLVIDNNEIMARDSGALSDLFFQDAKITMKANGEVRAPGFVGDGFSAIDNNAAFGGDAFSLMLNNFSESSVLGSNSAHTSQMWLGVTGTPAVSGNESQFLVFENTTGFSGGAPGSWFYPLSDNQTILGAPNQRWIAVYALNGTIQTSDMRLKKDIEVIGYGLETVRKMNPVSYRWKDAMMGDDKKIGFLAQEMEQLIPEAVTHHEGLVESEASAVVDRIKDPYGMNYSELIPVLTKSIQELADENDILKERLSQLEQMLKDLQDK